ncbi:MAG: NAD(P)-dependent oxidoreductase [Betaproteobacteria bacterium]|nr:NAD(P)-dependent oxidoreductase [Betaproteobacteria bacterium]
MTRSRRTALVTGGRGFLGSRCLPLLVRREFEVIAVTSTGNPDDMPGVKWRSCNLLDPIACAALIDQVRPSHLLHAGWVTKPNEYWTSPENLDWLNAGVRLVADFYAQGGQRAVGLGSCAEYAIDDSACTEDLTPIDPATVYGKAKAAMHFALQAAAQGRGSYAWGRLFFPYGLGEPLQRFIPSVILGLLRGEPIPCTQGTQVRDFVFVTDAAAACVALLDAETSGAYNIASGSGVSLREVAELIVRRLGHAELLEYGSRKAPEFDPPRIVANIAKISRDTDWRPSVTLEEGLAQYIADLQGGPPDGAVQNARFLSSR